MGKGLGTCTVPTATPSAHGEGCRGGRTGPWVYFARICVKAGGWGIAPAWDGMLPA